MEFESHEITQEAIVVVQQAFGALGPKEGNHKAWFHVDTSVEQRSVTSSLLGLRYILTQPKWGFNKKYFKVDGDAGILKAGREPILHATVEDGKLKLAWLDPAREKWEELQTAPEWQEVQQKANDRLMRSAANSSKGVGKGKPAQ